MILVACEESQTVCKAFRELGHETYSCDIEPCSGGYPEWHFQCDVKSILNDSNIIWDLVIAHPPCTYLCSTGQAWNYKPSVNAKREPFVDEAINFFMYFFTCFNIKRLCVENPVGIISTRFRKPDQYIEPCDFGHTARKKTGLWLINLPKLEATITVPPLLKTYIDKHGKIRTRSVWMDASDNKKERAKFRSKTFDGIAEAMAEQWGKLL